ncbi:MAG: glycosyltransferase family 2 protein [Spirulinaceae cyanobacterium RM2_2_10]|nr:glycosyltransferase family 2 protein [Spirulinaceae cyanobacterium RM2_2_10]
MMTDFSVVIPTYNGEKHLPEILERLRSQVETEGFSWEILVVDNNSSDRTPEIIRQAQTNWHGRGSLRYVVETQQGAAFARQRGVEEATGGWVGCLDDDNLPAQDWVARAYEFSQSRPQMGAFGGRIHADFEVEPPANFEKIIGFLAIRERGDHPSPYKPEVLSLPPGAAMVVRRQAWLDHVPAQPSLGGKIIGGSMVQGDDWEPLLHMYKAGWKIWYSPDLHTHHQIPAWRLEREYLLRLIHGSCLAFCPLRMIVAEPLQRPLIMARTVLGNTYRALSYWLRHRTSIRHDTVAACELQIYLSRIASVFYFLKGRWQGKFQFTPPVERAKAAAVHSSKASQE